MIYNTTDLTAEYGWMKDKVDAVVGAENNMGCSGGWVNGVAGADWAVAAFDAGFSYLDGAVLASLFAVPIDNRPTNPETGQPFTDEEIDAERHAPVFPNQDFGICPMRLANTADLAADASGVLFMPSPLTQSVDYNAFLNMIDYANCVKDNGRSSAIYVHIPPGEAGGPLKLAKLNEWLQVMKSYQDAGRIKWRTMQEIVDQYECVEAGNTIDKCPCDPTVGGDCPIP